MKRSMFFLFMVLLTSYGFAAGTQEPGQGDDGAKTVTILVVTSPETEALKACIAEFNKTNPNIEIVLNEQGRLGYFTNVTTQLVGGTDAFDLVQDNTTYMTELAAAGALEPWDDYLNNPELTNLAEYDLDDLPVQLKYEGRIYCIPTDLSSQLYFYRKDLIDKPAETWEDVIVNAKKFTRSLNPDSPTVYGTLLTALTGGPEAPKIFYNVLWSMGGDVIDENGNVVVNSEAARKAGAYYRSLRPYMAEDVTTYNYPKVFDALKAGTTAQAGPFWNAAWNNLQSSDSPNKDKYSIALVPGVRQKDGSIYRTPQTHGWGLMINKNSNNKVAAWKFLVYATSKEGFRIRGKNGSSVFRPSILNDPSYATTDAEKLYMPLMAKTYSIAKLEPLVSYYTKLHEILNRMVAGFLTTDDDIGGILERTEKEIIELKKNY